MTRPTEETTPLPFLFLPRPGDPAPPLVAPNVRAWRYVELRKDARPGPAIYITFIHANRRGAGMAYLEGQKVVAEREGVPLVIVAVLSRDFQLKLEAAGFRDDSWLIADELVECMVWDPRWQA